MRNYKRIANEDGDYIKGLIEQEETKSSIAVKVGCTRKTLLKVLNTLGIQYDYYKKINGFNEDGMKKCVTCNKNKRKEDYYFINSRSYLSTCKDCVRKEQREKYNKRADEFNDYKSSLGCSRCLDKRAYVLDFHHKDRDLKEFTIAKNPNASLKSPRFKEELDKCILLCSNCHREFHYLEREEGISLDEYIKRKVTQEA